MKNTIKINYYDHFKCTADQCPYTCCQEWTIAIDEETRHNWKGKELRGKVLCDCLEKDGSDYIMTLDENRKCPFLNENQLCGMVVEWNEDYLSDICKGYPRHISCYEDREEYGLDFGCPAVIDLLSASQEGISFLGEETLQHTSTLYEVRSLVIEILGIETYTLTERILMAFYCLLDLLEQEELTEELLEEYRSDAYLQALAFEMKKIEVDTIDSFWERNDVFLNTTEFYHQIESYTAYLEDIIVCAQQLEQYYSDEELEEKIESFHAHYIAYEKFFQNYLQAELWANMLRRDINLEEMVMVFEWVVLEYCTIKHAAFLTWLKQERKVSYEMVREAMMMISRMSSDDFEDIKEDLTLTYESPIFDWIQMALIVGKGRL